MLAVEVALGVVLFEAPADGGVHGVAVVVGRLQVLLLADAGRGGVLAPRRPGPPPAALALHVLAETEEQINPVEKYKGQTSLKIIKISKKI